MSGGEDPLEEEPEDIEFEDALGDEDLGDPDDWFPDVTSDEADSPAPEEEEVTDSLDRTDIGIDGLDEMISGGVPIGTTLCVMGSAGTGKTTFGMQFLHEGLENGEKVVFMSLEQEESDILSTADEKGWGFTEYEDQGELVVIHMDPIEVATTLQSIRNELPRMISEFGASRVVLDSVTLIEMMFESKADSRNQIYKFMNNLGDAGATTLVTSEAAEDNPYKSRYGTIEYLSDAVFVLQYVRSDTASETRLALEITKIRDTSHSREIKPYELTGSGIKVYSSANIF